VEGELMNSKSSGCIIYSKKKKKKVSKNAEVFWGARWVPYPCFLFGITPRVILLGSGVVECHY
jgi:hypothetical protein